MENNWVEINKHAMSWIHEAGERIRESFSEKLLIHTKSSNTDLVTNIDKEIEQFFINKIHNAFPSHKILGEEGYGDKLNRLDGVVWIIDPIDGTMNFIHQQRNFAISIGIYENGVGVLGYIFDVVHNELYYAKKGEGAFLNDIRLPNLTDVQLKEALIAMNAAWITENKRINYRYLAPIVKHVHGVRSYGSAALELAYVAAGRLDAYLTMRLSPWDYAAAMIIINEVGGVMTTVDGEPLSLLSPNSVLAAAPKLQQTIISNYIKVEFKSNKNPS